MKKKEKIDKIVYWSLLLMGVVMCIVAVIGLSNEGWTLTIGSFACLCMALFFTLLPYHLDNTRRIKELEKNVKLGGKG